MDLTYDPCQIAKIGRRTARRRFGFPFSSCTGSSSARTRLRQRRELVPSGTGSLRRGEVVETLKESPVARRANFEWRAGYIECPLPTCRLLLPLVTLLTPSLSGFECESELLTNPLKTHTSGAGSDEFIVFNCLERLREQLGLRPETQVRGGLETNQLCGRQWSSRSRCPEFHPGPVGIVQLNEHVPEPLLVLTGGLVRIGVDLDTVTLECGP